MGPVSIGVEVQRNTDGDTPSTILCAQSQSMAKLICDKWKNLTYTMTTPTRDKARLKRYVLINMGNPLLNITDATASVG